MGTETEAETVAWRSEGKERRREGARVRRSKVEGEGRRSEGATGREGERLCGAVRARVGSSGR